ncbi:MAG: protein-L-isoaspartate(D-aspartate) O-methyltransferase [Gammaproteobacteria bacterium]
MNTIDRMIADIEREVDYTKHLIGRDAFSARVMQAMRDVPRDRFVPSDMKRFAFFNGPLSIGHGQTISQPYIVALMTDLLEPTADDSVLEIGTGCGYQTAVLSELVKQVYSVEIVAELSRDAAQRLKSLHYDNVTTRIGNGYRGWPEFAPYDGIIVTAAATHIPQALVDQLKPGGRMVLPVGLPYAHQELILLKKDDKGDTEVSDILAVAFVPLVDVDEIKHN